MLTEELVKGNHQYDIPDATIDNEVASLVKDIELAEGFNPHVEFDPEKHIIFTDEDLKSVRKITLTEMGIEKTHVNPVCDLGGTDPFPLFSQEAVQIMKWEIFHNKEVVKKYGRLPNLAKGNDALDFQMAGFLDHTPFTNAAWSHPKVQEIINSIVGVKMKIPHVYSRSALNASLAKRINGVKVPDMDDETLEKLRTERANNPNAIDEIPSSVSWHYDSPPFVCVMMLSAPENMVGGETGLKIGDESYVTVPNPKEGYATLLQGRVVKHIATKPINSCDRISYVISCIPEDIDLEDTTVITSEKASSAPSFTNNGFYPHYMSYRFERIEQRLKKYREMLIENYKKEAEFDQHKSIEFCQDIEKYLKGCWQELEAVNDDKFPPPLYSVPYAAL